MFVKFDPEAVTALLSTSFWRSFAWSNVTGLFGLANFDPGHTDIGIKNREDTGYT